MVRSFRPDAVILDLMLPKMTGVEVMKQIRTEPDFKELPVIAFSNTYLTNMVQDAWKAGATKCLSKANCTPKQVIEAVRNTLTPKGALPPRPRRLDRPRLQPLRRPRRLGWLPLRPRPHPKIRMLIFRPTSASRLSRGSPPCWHVCACCSKG